MGYCHKCQHDCTEKDPCPCCRNHTKYTPYYPSIPYPYTDPIRNPYTHPPTGPIKPIKPTYWCGTSGTSGKYLQTKTITKVK